MSGVLLVFALILVWAFFSYSENGSTMQTSSGVISRDQNRLGSKEDG